MITYDCICFFRMSVYKTRESACQEPPQEDEAFGLLFNGDMEPLGSLPL